MTIPNSCGPTVGASSPAPTAKTEITLFDPQGVLNQNLDETADRLFKGASWKHQRTVVIIPTSERIHPKIALSWWNLMFPPNQPCIKTLAMGMEVGKAYSECIEHILAHPELSKWEYVLTIEHDNAPPPDGVLKLMAQMDAHPELDCISGGYFTKGIGGVYQCWGDIKDPNLNFRPQPPQPGQLVECYGTGMGFALWRLKMFADPDLERPLFQTKASAEGIGTQDLSFWMNARKHGYRCAVDCDVRVGHYEFETGIMW